MSEPLYERYTEHGRLRWCPAIATMCDNRAFVAAWEEYAERYYSPELLDIDDLKLECAAAERLYEETEKVRRMAEAANQEALRAVARARRQLMRRASVAQVGGEGNG